MSQSDRTAATTAGKIPASEIPPREIPVQSRAWVGHAALLLVQLLFGLFPVSGALAFEPGGFSPFGVAAWRIAVGGLVLGGLALLLFRRRALPARRDLPALLVAALLGIVANQGLYLSGLERSTPANAGLRAPPRSAQEPSRPQDPWVPPKPAWTLTTAGPQGLSAQMAPSAWRWHNDEIPTKRQ